MAADVLRKLDLEVPLDIGALATSQLRFLSQHAIKPSHDVKGLKMF